MSGQVEKYLEWFEKAEKDFISAKILIENKGFPETIAFLSQQTIEKYLKGYLLYMKETIPLIHDVFVLCKKSASHNKGFEQFYDDCKFLNAFYIEARYPMDFPVNIKDEDGERTFDIADRVIRFVKSIVR